MLHKALGAADLLYSRSISFRSFVHISRPCVLLLSYLMDHAAHDFSGSVSDLQSICHGLLHLHFELGTYLLRKPSKDPQNLRSRLLLPRQSTVLLTSIIFIPRYIRTSLTLKCVGHTTTSKGSSTPRLPEHTIMCSQYPSASHFPPPL